MYAAHLDAHIFSFYSQILSNRYEEMLEGSSISKNVLAYRRFSPSKTNIDFAVEAFEEIPMRLPCIAVAFDIEDFFGSIPHKELKEKWKQLLGKDLLPGDHFSVFKAITKYAWVDKKELYKALGIGRRRAKKLQPTGERVLCSGKEFREKVRKAGIIMKNLDQKGIPQGAPISAFLSNLVMIDLDQKLSSIAEQLGGVYRRYSDDILFIGSEEVIDVFKTAFEEELEKLGLKVNHNKTEIAKFWKDAENIFSDRPLQYLGLTFDGQKILLRCRTLSRFVRRRKRAIRQTGAIARKRNPAESKTKLFKNSLYERFSHLGKKRSFFSYVRRAKRISGSGKLLRQMRRHWKALHDEISEQET